MDGSRRFIVLTIKERGREMRAKTHDEIRRIYESVDTVKRLSDRIIGIGPINIIGLDGILSWFPVIGIPYSIVASLFLLVQGVRAHVGLGTWLACLMVLVANDLPEVFAAIPVIGEAGSLVNTLFQGHLYAAHMIQKDIDKTFYVAGRYHPAEHQEHLAEMRSTQGKRRLVYLG